MRDISENKPVQFYNMEAEQQLLGAVLMGESAYHRCSDLIGKDQFYHPVHGDIWEICARRIEKGETVSPVILKTIMAQHRGLAELGGPSYLVKLAGASVWKGVERDLAGVISDLWRRRTVIGSLERAVDGLNGGGEVSDALQVVSAVSEALSLSDGRPSSISYMKALTEAVGEISETAQKGISGLSTGIKDFDKLVGPLRGGDLIILGGAPSMGKSSMALAIADHVADAGVGVALVSLEMTGQSLAFRALGAASGVPYDQIISGDLDQDTGPKVQAAAGKIKDRPVEIVQPHIKDLHAINAAIIRIRAKMEARGQKLGLVLIDYLQLVRAPGKDRYAIVSAVSSGIKSMAMTLNIPIIALAQLSRAVMDREDKRPKMYDLRESGQIEQDADMVLFVHREEYYLERERPKLSQSNSKASKDREMGSMADHDAALSACKNKMEVILAKRRMGKIGSVMLGCDVATNRIWSLSENQNQEDFF